MATRQAGTIHLLRGLETGGSLWSGNMEPLNLPKGLQAPLRPITDSWMPQRRTKQKQAYLVVKEAALS